MYFMLVYGTRVMIWSLDGVSGASADGSGEAESDDHAACLVLRCLPTDCPQRGNTQVWTDFWLLLSKRLAGKSISDMTI